MKKKPIFNSNEVDIDLLFNQPKALRKFIGKKKRDDEDEEDINKEEELDEDEEDQDTNKNRLSPHMKRYIDDYLDSKHKRESEQRGKVKQRLDLIKKGTKMYNDAVYGSDEEYEEFKNRFKIPKKGIIQKKIDDLRK